MPKLQPGDEIWLTTCDWCGKGTSEENLTPTLDGAEVCPTCIAHYDSNFDIVTDTDEGVVNA